MENPSTASFDQCIPLLSQSREGDRVCGGNHGHCVPSTPMSFPSLDGLMPFGPLSVVSVSALANAIAEINQE